MLTKLYTYISLEYIIWSLILLPLSIAALNALTALFSRSRITSIIAPWAHFLSIIGFIKFIGLTIILTITLNGFDNPSTITSTLFQWFSLNGIPIIAKLYLDQMGLLASIAISVIHTCLAMFSWGYFHSKQKRSIYLSLIGLSAAGNIICLLSWHWIFCIASLIVMSSLAYICWHLQNTSKNNASWGLALNLISDFTILIVCWTIERILSESTPTSTNISANIFNLQLHMPALIPFSKWLGMLLFAAIWIKYIIVMFFTYTSSKSHHSIIGHAIVSQLIQLPALLFLFRLNILFSLTPEVLHTFMIAGFIASAVAGIMALSHTSINRIALWLGMACSSIWAIIFGYGFFAYAFYYMICAHMLILFIYLCIAVFQKNMPTILSIHDMGSIKSMMPITSWCLIIAMLSTAGIFPSIGFAIKIDILWTLFEHSYTWAWLCLWIIFGIHAFAAFRCVSSICFGHTRLSESSLSKLRDPSFSMALPLLLLSSLTILGGILHIPILLDNANPILSWLSSIIPAQVHSLGDSISSFSHIMFIICFIIIMLHTIIMAWLTYAQRRDIADRWANALRIPHHIFKNELYIGRILSHDIWHIFQWPLAKMNALKNTHTPYWPTNLIQHHTHRLTSIITPLESSYYHRMVVYMIISAVLILSIIILD